MAKYCYKCGAEIKYTAKFCPACGANVAQAAAAAPIPKGASTSSAYTEDRTLEEMFLKKDGRLNRLRYLKRMLAVFGARLATIVILWIILSDSWGNVSAGVEGLITIASLAYVYPEYCLTLRRLKDLNIKDLKMALWFVGIEAMSIIAGTMTVSRRSERKMMFLGIAAIIMFIYMVVKQGTKGTNQYGPDPLGLS